MLTDAIKNSGLSRSDFAARLGIGCSYLSLLEHRKKKPSLDLAFKIERLTAGKVPAESWIDNDDRAA